MDTNDSINPDVPELLQEEQDAVPHAMVKHVGPIEAHPLPARVAHSRTIRVTDSSNPANLEIIASEDHRRQYVTVICTEQAIHIGHDKQMVADGTAGILPPEISLTLPTSAPIWVRSFDPAGAQVSYWIGQWAD